VTQVDNHEDNVRGLKRLSAILDIYPAAFDGDPLNLLFVEADAPIRSADAFLRALDGPTLLEERRQYLLGSKSDWPFPTVEVGCRPDPWAVSHALFTRFHVASEILKSQSDIGPVLYEMADPEIFDVVALMVVDGLSYYDLPEQVRAEPCLVRGVTTTDYGVRQVIGRPSISQTLFSKGYCTQIGLTFYDVHETPLARELYAPFGAAEVSRVNSFQDAMDVIVASHMRRGYVQVISPGLDSLCHHHLDVPPRSEYLGTILDRFETLLTTLSGLGCHVLGCLTADHGIMWRDHMGDKIEIAERLVRGDQFHPRYVLGSVLAHYSLIMRLGGRAYSLLAAPYLTRPLRHGEWGVHGGISAWESIVPMIIRTQPA